MRYVVLKQVVSRITDKLLDDPEDIHNVLNYLCKKELTCSLQVKGNPLCEFARILKVEDDSIVWRMMKANTNLKKESLISDIETVQVFANDELMIQLKPNPSRWNTLDT